MLHCICRCVYVCECVRYLLVWSCFASLLYGLLVPTYMYVTLVSHVTFNATLEYRTCVSLRHFFCFCIHTASSGRLQIGLNISLPDANSDTPLGLALWTKQFTVAKQMLSAGADVETSDEQGRTLLHLAIVRRLPEVCIFLLDNGASFKGV